MPYREPAMNSTTTYKLTAQELHEAVAQYVARQIHEEEQMLAHEDVEDTAERLTVAGGTVVWHEGDELSACSVELTVVRT